MSEKLEEIGAYVAVAVVILLYLALPVIEWWER